MVVGLAELIVVAGIAVVVIGPERVAEAARLSLGRSRSMRVRGPALRVRHDDETEADLTAMSFVAAAVVSMALIAAALSQVLP